MKIFSRVYMEHFTLCKHCGDRIISVGDSFKCPRCGDVVCENCMDAEGVCKQCYFSMLREVVDEVDPW